MQLQVDCLTNATKAIHLVDVKETISEVPNKADFKAIRP